MTVLNRADAKCICFLYNEIMIDTNIYTQYPEYGAFTCDDVKYNPDKVHIKDLLYDHYNWFEELDKTGKARPCVLDNVQKTLLCNSVYLGFDIFECPSCKNEMIIHKKCHSRFCPSCGVKVQRLLAARVKTFCLDVNHRHFVFTIPEPYRYWFRKDRSALNLLYVAARNTLCKVLNEPIYRKEKRKWQKSGKLRNEKDNYYLYRNFKNQNVFGMIATIHTFGRALNWNPHIHALVPEVIYDPKKKKYRRVTYFDFTNLRKTWMYELNRLLIRHFGKKFYKITNQSYIDQENGYYVYARQQEKRKGSATDNVGACVEYMMRYAARPAMAESRILHYDKQNDIVEWYYDDHKTGEHVVVKELTIELLKKMIIHIPDDNFKTVRYYGFYNSKQSDILDLLHEQLDDDKQKKNTKEKRAELFRKAQRKHRWRTSVLDSFNRDMLRCKCGIEMKYIDSYNPLKGKTNDRYYRQHCIDEMRILRIRRIPPA